MDTYLIQDILLDCVEDSIQRSIIYVLWPHGAYNIHKAYYVYYLYKEKTDDIRYVLEQF